MSISVPPPIIAAFEVFEVKPEINKATRRVQLTGDQPRAVNSEDIKQQVFQPGLFILRWQEIHYSITYNVNGAPMITEACRTYNHYENQKRVEILRDLWGRASATNPPNVISLEQELTDLGWQFQYVADVGPLIPDHLVPGINWAIPGGETTGPEIPKEAGNQHHDGAPNVPDTPQNNGQLNELLLKIEMLTNVVERLVTQGSSNAASHRPTTSQLDQTRAPILEASDYQRYRP